MVDTVTVTRPELADLLAVHERTIAKWQADGLPVLRRGRGGSPSEYNFAVAFRWARDMGKFMAQAAVNRGGVSARDRKEMAQAVESEQRIAIKAKTLIAVDEVEKHWTAIVTTVRAKLLAMPTELSDRVHLVAVTDGAPAVEALLEESIHETLRELASGGPVKPPKAQKLKARKAKRR
jgi:phage terminase Nu1 subunit (DNA packaging protein)